MFYYYKINVNHIQNMFWNMTKISDKLFYSIIIHDHDFLKLLLSQHMQIFQVISEGKLFFFYKNKFRECFLLFIMLQVIFKIL